MRSYLWTHFKAQNAKQIGGNCNYVCSTTLRTSLTVTFPDVLKAWKEILFYLIADGSKTLPLENLDPSILSACWDICLPTSSLCERHLLWACRSFWLPQISTPTWNTATEHGRLTKRSRHSRYHSKTKDSSLPGETSELAFYMLHRELFLGEEKERKYRLSSQKDKGENHGILGS